MEVIIYWYMSYYVTHRWEEEVNLYLSLYVFARNWIQKKNTTGIGTRLYVFQFLPITNYTTITARLIVSGIPN